MARTADGKKKVHVKPHTKTDSSGKKVKVKRHYRSTPK